MIGTVGGLRGLSLYGNRGGSHGVGNVDGHGGDQGGGHGHGISITINYYHQMVLVMALVMVVVMVLTPQPWGPERVPVGHRRLRRTHKDKF